MICLGDTERTEFIGRELDQIIFFALRGFSSPLTNTLTCLHSNLSLRLYLSRREKTKLNLLPGQGPSSQSWLSKGSPIHFPPGPGGGLSHRRVLIAVPGPHDSLQELQGLHSPQPPLTTKVKETRNDLYCKHYCFISPFFILQWEIQSLATWSLSDSFAFLFLCYSQSLRHSLID